LLYEVSNFPEDRDGKYPERAWVCRWSAGGVSIDHLSFLYESSASVLISYSYWYRIVSAGPFVAIDISVGNGTNSFFGISFKSILGGLGISFVKAVVHFYKTNELTNNPYLLRSWLLLGTPYIAIYTFMALEFIVPIGINLEQGLFGRLILSAPMIPFMMLALGGMGRTEPFTFAEVAIPTLIIWSILITVVTILSIFLGAVYWRLQAKNIIMANTAAFFVVIAWFSMLFIRIGF